jgi:hypothetical protein
MSIDSNSKEIIKQKIGEALGLEMGAQKEFEKSVDHDDVRYYRLEDDNFNAIKKQGWYIRDAQYDRPIALLEPFKHCPWCAAKLKKL